MSEANRALIERLYGAMNAHDGDGMAACYADDATFRDPAFGDLDAEGVRAMWRMLCSRAEDLTVELAENDAGEDAGAARWIASYTFRTGRPVVNDIRATYRFRDGLITEHIDEFSFHTWARQALGPVGAALGWNPAFRAIFRAGARRELEKFRARSATA